MKEEELQLRIERLERQYRRTRNFSFLSIVCLLLVVVATVLTPQRAVVRARELILTDSNDNVVARFSSNRATGCLEILGTGRATSAQLCAGDGYGATLILRNDRNMTKAVVSAGAKILEGPGGIAPGVMVSDNNGRQVSLAVQEGKIKFSLGGPEGTNSFVISSTGESEPTLRVTGATGQGVWSAPPSEKHH